MGYSSRFELGTWNAVCSLCDGQFKAYELRKHWQGQYRCDNCWEPRHPQDFVRATRSERAPPWTQPGGVNPEIFVCDLWSSSPLASFGAAGCMTVGGNTSIPLLIDLFHPRAIAGIAIAGRSIPGVLA